MSCIECSIRFSYHVSMRKKDRGPPFDAFHLIHAMYNACLHFGEFLLTVFLGGFKYSGLFPLITI